MSARELENLFFVVKPKKVVSIGLFNAALLKINFLALSPRNEFLHLLNFSYLHAKKDTALELHTNDTLHFKSFLETGRKLLIKDQF